MTVWGVDRGVEAEFPGLPDEAERTAVDVEACASVPDVKVSGKPWSLLDDKNGRYTASGVSQNPVLPEYPGPRQAVAILQGECMRGWLLMDVPQDASLAKVRWSPTDPEGKNGATFEWDVAST